MKTLTKITARDIHPRLFLSPGAELFDCTGQGHDRFAVDNHASVKTGWVRLLFVSDKYSGQRLVIENRKVNDEQAIVIAQVIKLSKVQTVSLYAIDGTETRIVSATAEKYMKEVFN